MKQRSLPIPAFMIALLFACWATILYPLGAANAAESSKDDAKLAEVRQLISEYYVDPPATEVFQKNTIPDTIKALGDKHSLYLDEKEFKDLLESVNMNYFGVGMVIAPGGDYPLVEKTFPNSPAEKAGIQSGDAIIQINGESTHDLSVDKLAGKVRGPEGTTVSLVLRPAASEEERTIELKRQRIDLPQVEGKMLEGTIGYIHLSTFGDRTGKEFKAAYEKLQGAGMKQLIIDLRGNGGGEVTAAEEVGDFLLPEGPLYHMAGRKLPKETFSTTGKERPLPMAVLVDDGTASASELLSGALRDRAHATLIGTRTYGKGSVQTFFNIKSGGVLKLTIARYTTALDHPVDKVGLTPDQPVELEPLQLIRAKDVLSPPHPKQLRLTLDQKEASVSNDSLTLVNPPVIQDDRTYLPLRFLGEALGGTVEYREGDQRATVTVDGKVLDIPLYGGEVQLNQQHFADVEPLPVVNDRVLAPVRVLSESLGFQVDFNEDTREVRISKP
ncbi:PDZ domain-containing protein [Heliobacterium gestii]|uniref:PDZ domain-containing protein n=1 Tax=Heliomicrobium gestii TaxID=2699 RepID=A0A845L527_HELGE|nr:S41 family peptidase [Heliomicrobium gestii]MBM7865442.1 carboxyl-terminal processing protease [Heliomicrobium gestii]MZP41697.1 PDZ domain-containing protein [Heliomicrobium gestii]